MQSGEDIESDLTIEDHHNWRWVHTESAIEFDGEDDHITIEDNSDIPTGASSFTVEAWIRPDLTETRGILSWRTLGIDGEDNSLQMNSNNGIRHTLNGQELPAYGDDLNLLSLIHI